MRKYLCLRNVWVLYPIIIAAMLSWMIAMHYARFRGRALNHAANQSTEWHATASSVTRLASLDEIHAMTQPTSVNPSMTHQKDSPPISLLATLPEVVQDNTG